MPAPALTAKVLRFESFAAVRAAGRDIVTIRAEAVHALEQMYGADVSSLNGRQLRKFVDSLKSLQLTALFTSAKMQAAIDRAVRQRDRALTDDETLALAEPDALRRATTVAFSGTIP